MYRWMVFLHVLSVLAFLLAHGASAAMIFLIPGTRSVERLRALLDVSRRANGVANAALLLLLAAGIIAGFMGNWWGQYWIWASLVVLVLISVGMFAMSFEPLTRIRRVVSPEDGPRGRRGAQADPSHAVQSGVAFSTEEVAALVARINPWPTALLGGVGLAVILWLMMFKPF